MRKLKTFYQNTPKQWLRISLATLLWVVIIGTPAMATHIVGGTISYRCLGNDQYEITVRVYRDCYNGDPRAVFDDPASIGIFDRTGVLVKNVLVPFVKEDTVTNVPEACLVIPENVCVHTTTYVTTVELPFKTGGYQLVYQRCCRNVTVQNIIEPLETGATYDVWLTETAMNRCNSSPVFKSWPPVYICANQPLYFDHAATDADGDSLVYRLSMPLQGGTFAEPMPQPPNPPPYDEVMLIDPTYSIDNFLGFGDPLKVDANTGLMTATPGLLGQFVVGVCVDEYDRETGTLLSTTRRDFQYNVIQCEPYEAVFAAPDTLCDEFTVTFDNQTEDANDFLWHFEGADTSWSSTERNPEVTFPGPGSYNVELVVEPNSTCEVHFSKDIFVQDNSLTADFRVDVLACTDSSYLFLTDRSVDSLSKPISWEWIISPDGLDPITATGQFPIVAVPMDSKGTIQLNVTSSNSCTNSVTMPFEAPGIDLRTYLRDTIYACAGDSIFLNPDSPADVQLSYTWSGPGISDLLEPNPKIEAVAGTNTYYLFITGPPNSCVIDAEVVVIAGEDPGLDFSVATNCDGFSYHFEDMSTNSSSIEWIIGDLNAPLFISQESSFDFEFPGLGSYNVYLIGQAGCVDTLVKTVDVSNNSLDVGIDVKYTDCVDDQVEVRLMSQTVTSDSIVVWNWELEDGRSSTLPNPVFVFSESDTLSVSLKVETARGCVDSIVQEIEVNLLRDVVANVPDTLALCKGTSTALFPENDVKYSYEWSTEDGVVFSTDPNPVFSETGVYNVVISIPGSASCQVETQVAAIIPAAIDLGITVAEVPDELADGNGNNGGNGSGTGVDLDNLNEIPVVDGKVASCEQELLLVGSVAPGVQVDWYLNGELVSADSILYIAKKTGENTYTAIATDAYGCMDTSSVVIDLNGVDVLLPDSVEVCDGEAINITATNTDPSDTLSYNWTPADWITAGQGTANVSADAAPIGINYVYVEVTNQNGCSTIDSVEVIVVDSNHDLDFDFGPFCNGTTVNFINQSQDAFGYLWNFGDPNNPNATSTEENPSYTYSEPGTYTALLTLQYDVSCRDTIEKTFVLTDSMAFDADFTVDLVDCQPGMATFQIDGSASVVDSALMYTYTLEDGRTFEDQSFELILTEGVKQTITLVVSDGECSTTIDKMIEFPVVEINLPDTTVMCDPAGITLNEGGSDEYIYNWALVGGITDSTQVSPFVRPDSTTTYTVSITAEGFEACVVDDTTTVIVPDERLVLDLPDTIFTMGEPVSITTTVDAASYTWTNSNQEIIGTDSTITVDPECEEYFYLQVTDKYGCEYRDTVLVINQGIEVVVSPVSPIKICEGQEVQITVENLKDCDTLFFEWGPDSIIVSGGDTDSPVFGFDTRGDYQATGIVRNQYGVTDTLYVEFNVGDIESGLMDTVLVCGEDSVRLGPNTNPEYTYQWDPDDNLDDAKSNNPLFSGTENSTYMVTVTGDGCEVIDTVQVIVDALVKLEKVGETPDTACVGLDLTLQVDKTGDNATTEWYQGEDFTPLNVTGEALDITVGPGTNTYFAIATSPAGCADTVRYDIEGVDLESLDLMSPLKGCIGDAFDLLPGADPAYNYSWEPSGLLDSPADSPNPRTLPLENDAEFYVTVTLPQAAGCELTDTVLVDVKDDIIVDITADPGLEVCPQTTVVLTAELEEGATIVWLDADGNILGEADTLSVDVGEEPIEITAVATDTTGCEQRQTITITPDEINAGLDSPVEACAEIPTELNPGGNPDYIYQWSAVENDSFDLTDPSNPIVTLTKDQSFDVTVTDTVSGCSLEKTVDVMVQDNPYITLTTNDTMICEPTTITLMAETNIPSTLEWFADAAMTQSLGTGNSVEVTPGEGTTQYFVKTDDQLCVDEHDVDTVTVAVVDFSAVAPDTLLTICKGEAIELNPRGDDRFFYQWEPADGLDDPTSPNPVFDGNSDAEFMVTITSPDSMCSVVRMMKVMLSNPVNLDAGLDTILCVDGTYELMAGHEGGMNLMWSTDREFSTIISTSDQVEIELVDGGQYYYVKADNGEGCTEIDSVFVGAGVIDAMLPDEVQVCDAAEGAMLMVHNNKANQILDYLWSPENKLASDPVTGPTATLEPGEGGLISVMLENQFGCMAQLSSNVVINDVGSARIVASDTVIQVGNPVDLTVEGCVDCQYEWSSSPEGGNYNPNAQSITDTPLEPTDYTVKVTKGDCEVILTITILTEGVLCSEDNIFVPRAFTPNGDGQNDVLYVRSNVIESLHFVIYSRWGQEVFDTRDMNTGWDGTFRGNPLPPDVYGYYLQAICEDGSEIVLQGNVTLLR